METISTLDISTEGEEEFEIQKQEEHSETESSDENEEVLTDVEKPSDALNRIWSPSVYGYVSKECYHFAGYEITIHQSIDHFGAITWPAAVELCHFLECNWNEFNLDDKNVIELGAGTGLVSILAVLLGAYVTSTDLSCAIGNLQSNVMRNTRWKSKHQPQIKELAWNVDLDKNFPQLIHHYDYILAADVVYHHHYLDDLMATFDYFCQPDSAILWANKLRFNSDCEFLEKFKAKFDTVVLANIPHAEVIIIKGTKKSQLVNT
ncbi:protein-lysine methyltransferase METTL21E-like [Stegostoma tigrinum]|uniref:protein-lysine methyltransferase METTL21E-like n=1 Tax=Stegostoma tigrinum TaxID=3053191 RepID=UPI00202B3230|nr:protein-lysine methyltransferase METTL21E-like [Stegostoma tigrinum]XP_048389227.1 protein-lysine methyltransferase METTL21E-like [Stegostoma tigrinum]